jgi:nucleoside-diphosphate-sugar epimerase
VNDLYNTCKKELNSNWEAAYRAPREGDIRDSLADIGLAQTLLGYKPTKKFEDGLIETIQYFKKQYS